MFQAYKDSAIKASSVAISPDGQMLATGSEYGAIYLWRMSDGEPAGMLGGHVDYVFLVAFSADGQTMMSVAGGRDKRVYLWSPTSGSSPTAVARLTSEDQFFITIDATHRQYATFNAKDQSVTVSALAASGASSRVVARIGNTSDITSGAFNSDGQSLALGDYDGKVSLYQTSDGKLLRTLYGVRGEVGSLLFSPDGTRLAIGWSNGDIELRRTADGATVQTLKGHTKIVRTLSFSRDGGTLASGAEDRTIRLWRRQ